MIPSIQLSMNPTFGRLPRNASSQTVNGHAMPSSDSIATNTIAANMECAPLPCAHPCPAKCRAQINQWQARRDEHHQGEMNQEDGVGQHDKPFNIATVISELK